MSTVYGSTEKPYPSLPSVNVAFSEKSTCRVTADPLHSLISFANVAECSLFTYLCTRKPFNWLSK